MALVEPGGEQGQFDGLRATMELMSSTVNFHVVCFTLVLSLYFVTLFYSTVSGLERSFDQFFCCKTWRKN